MARRPFALAVTGVVVAFTAFSAAVSPKKPPSTVAEVPAPTPAAKAALDAERAAKAAFDAERAAAVADIASEKMVVEAMFPYASSTLWVSMIDDGTRRDGFASYVCLSMPKRVRATRVRILDAAKLARGKFETIGEYRCKVG
jgi:hypothetical protein